MTVSEKFNEIKKSATANNDFNYCGVMTLAIVTDSSYEVAYDALKKSGRKHRDGIYMSQLITALQKLNYNYGERVCLDKILDALRKYKNYNVKNLTTKTLHRNIKMLQKKGILDAKAKYVISTSGHVLACDGTGVVDWSTTSSLRIRSIREVV